MHNHLGLKMGKSAIWNCWVSAREVIKLHPSAHVPSKATHACKRSAILLPLKHLSSNCIISTLFYCLTMKQFFIKVPSKVRQAGMMKGSIKICSIVKLYNKVLISNIVQTSSCTQFDHGRF